jgi:transposase-like protein
VNGKEAQRGSIMTEQFPFKWRHFQAEIILLCVRWYLRYALSYRDLEEIMLERGLHVDHTTIYRSRPALRSGTGKALSTTPETRE